MDRLFKFLKIRRYPYILTVRFQSIITHENYKDMGMNRLDDLDRVFNGKAKRVGIEDNGSIVVFECHLDGVGGMIGNLDVVTFISQYAVEVPDQDRVL